jgi:hypothetical protein
MKEWRKLQWTPNRAYLSLRFSELVYAGLDIGKQYLYNVRVEGDKKIVVRFKRGKGEEGALKDKIVKEQM